MVRIVLFITSLVATSAIAQDKELSQYGHYAAYCAGSGGVLAWAPALVTHCELPDGDLSQQELVDLAMQECRASLASYKPRPPNSLDCRIAYDGNYVVDDLFWEIAHDPPPFLVQLTFNDGNGAAQRVTGWFQEKPWSDPNQEVVTFVVTADGKDLCEGFYYFGIGLKIETNCGGRTYKGTALTRKLITANGMVFLAPRKVTVRNGNASIGLIFD
ncbi:MAG: hypothetical protein AAF631_11925 [Pseudomonadota bacterium]